MADWLVLDVSYLARRALHTSGHLRHMDEATGTIFGIMGTAIALKERFDTEHVAWCFDHGRCLRLDALPSYKESRRKRKVTDQQAEAIEDMKAQVEKLRTRHLGLLGYQNVFWRSGYEADDLMAAICHDLDPSDRAILVTGDQDLYQLLDHHVAVYHPTQKELVTAKLFKAKYNIKPRSWVTVKCLAGCGTDDIPGIDGVGEATALEWLRTGTIKRSQKLQKAIERFIGSPEYQRNQELVRLPYHGLGGIPLIPDPEPPADAWGRFCEQLGFRSLIGVDGAHDKRLVRASVED